MPNGNGAVAAGKFVKTAGPWGVALLALLGVLVLAFNPSARASSMTATDGRELTQRVNQLERKFDAILIELRYIKEGIAELKRK